MRTYTLPLRVNVCALPGAEAEQEQNRIMAIFHLSAQTIGRSSGRSSVAACAYRHGARMIDERTGLVHDYTRKAGVAETMMLLPEGAPEWASDPAQLWNRVEVGEKRKDAQTAREINIALPVELNPEQRRALVLDYCREQFTDAGMVADVAFHDADTGNPHVHIMLTMRRFDGDGFGPKAREWNEKQTLEQWRGQWAEHTNRALELAGHEARIDHRTLEAQAVDAIEQGDEPAAIRLSREAQRHHGNKQGADIAQINDEARTGLAEAERQAALWERAHAAEVARQQEQARQDRAQAHEQQQAREAEGERTRAAQKAANEAKIKELVEFAEKRWKAWKMDGRDAQQRGSAEAQIMAEVRAEADKRFPAPEPTMEEKTAALNASPYFFEARANEQEAGPRLERADEALRAADDKIAPDIAQVNKLATLANEQRAAKDKAHEKAESLDFRLFGGEWLLGQYEKGSLTEKQAKTAKRFLETGRWGFWNKPKPEERKQVETLGEVLKAVERRSARVETAEREAREIRERIAPDVAAVRKALEEQKSARDFATAWKDGAEKAWKKVVASVPAVQHHEQQIRALVRDVVAVPKQQQQQRDQVRAQEKQLELTRQRAYERDHPQQSRGRGLSM